MKLHDEKKIMNKLEDNLHISIVPFHFATLSSFFVNMNKEKPQWHVNETVFVLLFSQFIIITMFLNLVSNK